MMSEAASAPGEDVVLVHDPARIAAWQADLDRLLPQWLKLEPEEQQWRLQRFLDKLSAQPELQPSLAAVLRQRLAAPERFGLSEPGIALLQELCASLELLQ